MRKSHLLFPILALTIVLGSCSSGGDEESPGDPAAQAPVPAAPAPAPAARAQDDDEDPYVKLLRQAVRERWR